MGAEPWDYFVPYEPDVRLALERLRRRVFQAGSFRYSELNPASIEEAIDNADADGTGSILDMTHVADEPDYGAVVRLPDEVLLDLFGTTQPTREMVLANTAFYDDIERGQGVYVVVYKDGKPSEMFFGGYSYD